ncbi:MAG: RecQ family ATP-dependent DNA helicase [Actinomycetota bacterium]
MLDQDAGFRPGQLEAIESVVEKRGRVLLVQRTGWGKSAVYFIATRLLRDAGAGPTLLVSPLLALMRNQMQMAERLGVRAETINSTNPEAFEPILDRLRGDEIDLLLVSPERFANERFTDEMLPLVSDRVGLLVIDEAHCISDWGHDFRPDYRRLVRVIDLLPQGVPVLCTTATANDRVIADVSEQLGEELVTLRGSLERESLELAAVDMPSQVDRLAWLARTIPKLDGSGIVYVLTVADTERVAEFLRLQGISAEAYSGGTDAELRPELEQRLLDDDVKALVATSALGMGFDKPDLGFVIHFQSPGSPIAYYQQVGRAGRSLDRAPAILFRGTEDRDIQDYFIETAFPTKRQAEEILALLSERTAPASLAQIEAEVNIRRGRLQQMLKILEVEGAVQRDGGRYSRTPVPWEYPAERVERITELRRQEQDAMVAYVEHGGCLMEFLRRELDDPSAAPCGRCTGCTGVPLDVSVDPELRGAALEFLRGSPLMLQARAQWPTGLEQVKGKIPEDERAEVGRVLSVYNDGGWGGLVRRGRDEDEHFDEALVEASAALIRDGWKPGPPPEWVTSVPSMLHPDLVPDFARRLADKLDLPFRDVVRKTAENQPQNRMENSAQQLRNVWGAFGISGEVPSGPALLVDDISDSRWTLTVIGRELRLAGCARVYPFALAKALST